MPNSKPVSDLRNYNEDANDDIIIIREYITKDCLGVCHNNHEKKISFSNNVLSYKALNLDCKIRLLVRMNPKTSAKKPREISRGFKKNKALSFSVLQ